MKTLKILCITWVTLLTLTFLQLGVFANDVETTLEDVETIEDTKMTEMHQIEKIYLDKTEVDVPDVVEITAEVSSEMAGGYFAIIMSNETGNEFYIDMEDTKENTDAQDSENVVFKGKYEISEFDEPGVYTIESINMKAFSGEYLEYDRREGNLGIAEEVSLIVNNSNELDVTAPTILDIKIDDYEIKEGEISNITIIAKDDISGIANSFYKTSMVLENENGSRVYVDLYPKDESWDDSGHTVTLAGKFGVHGEVESGNYHISEIDIADNADNMARYFYDSADNTELSSFDLAVEPINEYDKQLDFYEEIKVENKYYYFSPIKTIKNEMSVKAPDIIDITIFTKTQFENLNYITMVLESESENEDSEQYVVNFYKEYWDDETNSYIPLEGNTFKASTEINKYMQPGTYVATGIIFDLNGGRLWFTPPKFSIEVENENVPIDIYSSDIETIKNSPDNSTFLYTQGHDDAPTEILDAIKDTNKTVVWSDYDFNNSYLQLEFNGNNITKSCSFNTNYYFGSMDNYFKDYEFVEYYYDTDTLNEISELTNYDETAILMFGENGDLPGKAKMRITLPYEVRKAIGTKDIYVYTYDTESKQLVPVAENISLAEDGYLEFDVDSLETYIVTKGDINKQ